MVVATIATRFVKKNNTNKTKEPDFGWVYISSDGIHRIGSFIYEYLTKLPEDNTIPTSMAALGFKLSPQEAVKVTEELMNKGYSETDAVKTVIELNKLFSYEFPVRTQTLNNYPLVKVELLTEEMLEFINQQLGTNISYDAYVTAVKTIFTKENMRSVFLQLGISSAPNYVWDETSSATEDDDLLSALTAMLQQKNNQKKYNKQDAAQ